MAESWATVAVVSVGRINRGQSGLQAVRARTARKLVTARKAGLVARDGRGLAWRGLAHGTLLYKARSGESITHSILDCLLVALTLLQCCCFLQIYHIV